MLAVAARRVVGDEPPAGVAAADTLATEQAQHFVFRVLPVLRSKCLVCHGDDPDDLRGEYDMRTRAGLLRGGREWPARGAAWKRCREPALSGCLLGRFGNASQRE